VYTGTNGNLTAIEPTLTSAFQTGTGQEAMTLTTPAPATTDGVAPTGGTASTGNSYVINATSKSGVSYALVRNPDGTTARLCNVPSGTNASGCTITGGGTSGNGTW
jgi:hypothetical protein